MPWKMWFRLPLTTVLARVRYGHWRLKGGLQDRHRLRVLLALGDILAVNVVLFLLVKALVLYPLKFHELWEVGVWGALLLALFSGAQVLGIWDRQRFSWVRLGFQGVAFAVFVGFVAFKSNQTVTAKGWDFSWLRPEMIKVAPWIKMLAPLSPGFVVLFAAFVMLLLWWAIDKPESPWLRWLPTIATALLLAKVVQVFAPDGWGTGGVNNSVKPEGTLLFYLAVFGGPAAAVTALLWLRSFSLAFRLTPLAFHLTLIALHYMGTLPVVSLYEALPFGVDPHRAVNRTAGVSVFYPPPGVRAERTFLFLRKLVATPQAMYVNYGPTCGLYAIDRATRAKQRLLIPGLMRDMQLAPGRDRLWGLNWLNGDFLTIGFDPLAVGCQRDVFDLGLTTPYNMVVDGDRLFVTNVTHPKVLEFGWDDPADPCSLRPRRSLDFFETGFTKFTDGAFGLHLDRAANRLYVSVGLVAERNLSAIAEVDLETFTVSRQARMTGSLPIFPIAGRRALWAPSYYNAEMHEVSLDTMTVVRTIRAGPNLGSLAQDERRGLFYGLCRAPGMMQVIDDASGRIIKEVYVGAKPEPIWLDRENDKLYVASGAGILEIDLPVFLGEKPPAGARR